MMALAFVQSAASNSSNTIALTGVGAGNLIVLWAKWEDSASGGITVSDGTSSLSLGTLRSPGTTGPRGQFAYLLVANSGNKTYTVTWPSGALYKRLRIMEFSYTGTASLDTQNTATGTSNAPLSGNITTTGTDEVILGGYAEYSAYSSSLFKVNSAAAAGSVGGGATYAAEWYSIFTSTLANTNAGCTLSGSDGEWVCNVVAFKAVAAGGGGGFLNRNYWWGNY